MTLTDAQARILRAMLEGARLYGRIDNPRFALIWGSRPDEHVAQADVLALFRADYITPYFPWPDLTPAGAEALAQWEAGR